MILTGRAKEDFIDYLWQSKFKKDDYKEYEDYIENQKESHTYADLIEWFDSVGVYISIGYRLDYDQWTLKVETLTGSDYERGYQSRKETTKQAITKANQIYNEKFSR